MASLVESAEAAAIAAQIRTVALIAAASAIAILLVWVRARLRPSSRSTSRTTIGADRAARKWTEDDLDKVYLIAPSPYQRWTSHYSHPRSELTPSFGSASAADERVLADLLTPSKDWWQGHRAGNADNTPDTLQKLDFGEAPVVVEEEEVNGGGAEQQQQQRRQEEEEDNSGSGRKGRRPRGSATQVTRSSRASRRLNRSSSHEVVEEEEEEEEVTMMRQSRRRLEETTVAAGADDQERDLASSGRFGDDDAEEDVHAHRTNGVAPAPSDSESDNEAAAASHDGDRSASPQRSDSSLLSPASPLSPGSLDEMRDELASPPASRVSRGGRRASGTPSKHRRQWTHTVLPGIQEPRIHRKTPLH